MSTRQATVQGEVPSLKKLLTATAIAALAAAAILIAFVLPAEYGIDPLGSGRALGLGELANATEKPSKPVVASTPAPAEPVRAFINPVLVPAATGAPTMKDAFIAERRHFQFDGWHANAADFVAVLVHRRHEARIGRSQRCWHLCRNALLRPKVKAREA